MNRRERIRGLIGETARDSARRWKPLLLTDMVYKAIGLILLTPLVAILFRVFIAASGKTVLADQDILFFFIAPVGWLCFITVGALWLGILALELAALMAILAATPDQHLGVFRALRFASRVAWPVLGVAARLLAWTLAVVAPFLAVAAGVYFLLLRQYDINFYLQEKPPTFLAAVGIGVVLVVALLAVLLRLFTGWFFALPLVLFENTPPSQALRASRQRADGQRRILLMWILGWFTVTSSLSAVASLMVVALGHALVPRSTGSLGLLTLAVGASMLVWAAVGWALNLLSTTSFAAIHFHLYRHLGSPGGADVSPRDFSEAAGGTSRFQLTPPRMLVGGTTGLVAALAIGVFAVQSVRLDDNVQVIAHRGSSKAAPENTMAAIQRAIDEGADWVEIDVQETADGNVVVFHDSDFMKLAGVNLKIWNATLVDLQDIDVGSWFSDEFKGERVPTLSQVLERCKGKVGVTIELKYYGHDEQLEQRVVDMVEAHGMANGVEIMSLKLDAVRKMKSLRPNWRVGLLMSVSVGDLQGIDADFFAVNAAFSHRDFIRSAHASGKQVAVWTVNDAVTMSAMIGSGVDGLITDKPALARSVLQQRSQMSAPERLLVELAGIFGVKPQLAEQ